MYKSCLHSASENLLMNDARSDTHLRFENNPSPEVRNILSKKIDEFNDRGMPFESERFAFLLHDAADCLVGGLSGVLYRDWLFVEALWVDNARRGTGLGRELMKQAETHAMAKGCHSAWLDTFQACGFYEKLGYKVFGVLDDYPARERRWFLKKRLV
jgi:GNAT superfamily N-acetyltransferase